MRRLQALWRLTAVLAHVLHGMAVVGFTWRHANAAQREARIAWWAGKFLRLLGVGLRASGGFKPGACLLVANHVSWLDILAIHAVHPRARFVAKADVRHWPLLGWLIGATGSLFIERERKRDALRVVHQVAEALEAGDCVAVFPEGTTGAGLPLLPFHANLLQAAIATATPVQALALRYEDAHERFSPALLWLGQTTLAQSVWATLNGRQLTAVIEVMPPRRSDHADRRALAASLREDITTVLAGPP